MNNEINTPCNTLTTELSTVYFKTPLQSNKEQEIWEVKQLQADFVSQSHPSSVIENLKAQQKAKHNTLVLALREAIEAVAVDSEPRLRQLSADLKETINCIDSQINSFFDDTQLILQSDTMLTVQTVHKLKFHRDDALRQFSTTVEELERAKTVRIKEILKRYRPSLEQTLHLLPNDLQQFLQLQMTNINHVTLCNYQEYQDLILHLGQTGELVIEGFNRRLQSILNKWQNGLEKQDKVDNDLQSNDQMVIEIKNHNSTGDILKKLKVKAMDLNSVISQCATVFENHNVEVSRIFKPIITQIDISGNSLLYLANTSVEYFLKEFSECIATPMSALKATSEDSLGNSVLTALDAIEEEWLMSFTRLGQAILSETEMLKASIKVWKDHCIRMEKAKSVISNLLRRQVEANWKEYETTEVVLNIVLDELRQQPTQDKLDKTFEAVVNILEQLQISYKQGSDSEFGIVEEFQVQTVEIKLLAAEIQVFLSQHIGTNFLQSEEPSMPFIASTNSLSSYEDDIRTCEIEELQIKALNNCKQGIHEANNAALIICNMSDISRQITEDWASERRKEILEQLEKMVSLHAVRTKRIQLEICDVRKAEIAKHEKRLIEHKTGVKVYLDELIEEMKENQRFMSDEAEKLLICLMDKEQLVTEAAHSNDVLRCINEMEVKRLDIECSFKQKLVTLQTSGKYKIAWVQHAHKLFLNAAKMFSEGGNYSSDEAKHLQDSLMRLEAMLETGETNATMEIEEHCEGLLNIVDASMNAKLKPWTDKLFLMQCAEREAQILLILADDLKNQVSFVTCELNTLQSAVSQISQMVAAGETVEPSHWEAVVSKVLESKDIMTIPKGTEQLEWERLEDGMECDKQLEQGRKQDSKSDNKVAKDHKKTQNGISKNKSGIAVKTLKTKSHSEMKVKPLDKTNFQDDKLFTFTKSEEIIGETEYLATTKQAIYTALQQIKQNTIVCFHGADFDEHMNNVVLTLQRYNIECEVAWLQTSLDLLATVAALRHSCKAYAEQHIGMFHCEWHRRLTQIQDGMHDDLVQLSNYVMKERLKLDEQLKPLHGYPANKHLLSDLIAAVKHAHQKHSSEHMKLISTNKRMLRLEYRTYHAEMNCLSDELFHIQDIIFQQSLISDNFSELMKRMQRSNTSIDERPCKPTSCHLLQLELMQQRSRASLLAELYDLSNQLTVPSDELVLTEVYSERHISSINETKEDVVIEPGVIAVGSSKAILPFNIDKIKVENMQEVHDVFRFLVGSAESEIKIYAESSEKWYKLWLQNVSKVKKLYTVRLQ